VHFRGIQDFIGIDISDAGDEALIQQERLDPRLVFF
jgi:hypothetical protein